MPKQASTKNPLSEQEAALKLLLRLDRGKRRWRLLALILLGFVILGWLVNSVTHSVPTPNAPKAYVAHVMLKDMLVADPYQRARLQELASADSVKAVLVEIDSPGGTMVGGFDIYNQLSAIRAKKPVVAVMGTVAASAGYMVSLGTDHVIANPATLTGSIGVILPLVDASALAAKIGVKSNEITSGSLKAAGNPMEQMTAAQRQYFQNLVNEMNGLFKDTVMQRRQLTPAQFAEVADGRAVTGLTAKRLNLIDDLGDINTARTWLAEQKQISQELPLVEYELTEPHQWFKDLVGEAKFWGGIARGELPTQHAVWATIQ